MLRKLIGAAICAALLAAPVVHAAPAIQPFEPDGMGRIVASQKRQPFVLVVWSLDCEYCQASLKTLAQEKRKRKNLRVVTLSTDALDDGQAVASMNARLASLKLTGNAWAFGEAPPEQLRYAIDSKWHGEKPRSYWFNAKGENTAYSGVITPDVIAKFMPN